MQGMGGNLGDCRLPGPGTPGGEIGVPSPCPGLGLEDVPGTLATGLGSVWPSSDCPARDCLSILCIHATLSCMALLRVRVPIWLLLSPRVSGPG